MRTAACIAAAVSGLIGSGYLAAWLLGAMTYRGVSSVTTKTNTALCLLLSGLALVLLAPAKTGMVRRWAVRACAGMALLIGMLTLSEHVVGWDLGIDQLLAREPPGAAGVTAPNRMGPPASLSFALAGGALLVLSRRLSRGVRFAQSLAIAVCLISLLATEGYLYGVDLLYGIARFTGIALPTALGLLVLGVGLLCARPTEGLVAQVIADDPGGALLRRMLLPTILLPLGLGWVWLAGERLGWYDANLGTSLTVIVLVVAFTSLGYLASGRISRSAAALRETGDRCRATFNNAGAGITEVDTDDRFAAVNDRICQMLGYSREELLGMSVHDLTWPEDRPRSDQLNAQLRRMRLPMLRYEKRYLKRDGSPLWVDVAVSPLYDDAGRLLYAVATSVDISARKEAEAQVRLLAAALEAAPNAISLSKTDQQGTIVWVNAAFTRLTGYSAEEAIGQSHHILSSGRQGEAFYCNLWETIQRGEVWRGELVNRRKDGTLYDEEMGITPLRDEDGKFTYYVAIKQDITARKQAESALRESEERFCAYMDNSPAVAWAKDEQGRYVYMNRTFEERFRVRLEDWQGKTDAQVWPAEIARRFQEVDQAVLRTGRPAEAVEETLDQDGKRGYWWGFKFPFRDAAGRRYVGGMGVDITPLKHAEAALRESEERLRALVTASSEVLYRMNPDWSEMRQLHSRGFLANTEEPSRAWLQQYIPSNDQPHVTAAIKEAIRTKTVFELEHRVRRADGSLGWTFSRAVPLLDVNGEIVEWFGAASDVTERKRVEEATAAAQAAAEQASRSKDHFLAVLSHELRTPLTPVLAAVSMLREDLGLDSDLRESLDMILRNVELEARLVDDLLDVTRIARGRIELHKQPVRLCDVIRRAVEVCQPDFDARKLEFGIDLGPAAPYWIEADIARLQQVFWNLLKNAVKFTPQGGCVGIHCRRANGHVIADVNDSGEGIEPQAIGRIFNAFEQAEASIARQFGGLGLGLTISKVLVEMHGGTIEAHSAGKGKGATFRVRLPLVAAAIFQQAGAPRSPPAAAQRAARPLRVLLVEDHGDTARIISRLLSRWGHEVQTAGDAATALELAGRNDFDLLISDLGLPDRSGVDLIRELRSSGKTLPAIALSGYGQEEDINRSREAGFNAHLTKPIDLEQFFRTLAAVAGA